jgi:hypothetical protein
MKPIKPCDNIARPFVCKYCKFMCYKQVGTVKYSLDIYVKYFSSHNVDDVYKQGYCIKRSCKSILGIVI